MNFCGPIFPFPKPAPFVMMVPFSTPFAGESGVKNPAAEGATGPRKRSGKRTADEQDTLESRTPIASAPTE